LFQLTRVLSAAWCRFQSDIVHQSVMELIHSEDREQFKMQLNWRSTLSQDSAELTIDQAMQPGVLF